MPVEVVSRVSAEHKMEATGVSTNIREAWSRLVATISVLGYSEPFCRVVLANRFSHEVNRAWEVSEVEAARQIPRDREGGLVAGRLVMISRERNEFRVVVDYPGLRSIGAGAGEIEVIACHELVHAIHHVIRWTAEYELVADATTPEGGARMISQKAVEEYLATVLSSAYAVGVEPLSTEHCAAASQLQAIGGEAYLRQIPPLLQAFDRTGWPDAVEAVEAGTATPADLQQFAATATDRCFVLFAHAQAYTDIGTIQFPGDGLELSGIGRMLQTSWASFRDFLRPFRRIGAADQWIAAEQAALEAGRESITEMWAELGLITV